MGRIENAVTQRVPQARRPRSRRFPGGRHVTKPAIIAVAMTGSVPRKEDTPAVPVTPSEQIESTHAAFEAGATLAHIHVRNADQSPGSDPGLFAEVQDGIRRHCPGMIIQFSTGGRGRSFEDRLAPLEKGPEMASFTPGSVNFPTWAFVNEPPAVDRLAEAMLARRIKPEFEIFDAAMLYAALDLARRGLVERPLHVQFVLGIRNALPPRRKVLEFLVSELRELAPESTWGAAGIGRHQLEVNRWCLELGGHCRTGLEDNIYFEAGRLATSNAELVQRVAHLCGEYDRHPADPAEARALLHLPVSTA